MVVLGTHCFVKYIIMLGWKLKLWMELMDVRRGDDVNQNLNPFICHCTVCNNIVAASKYTHNICEGRWWSGGRWCCERRWWCEGRWWRLTDGACVFVPPGRWSPTGSRRAAPSAPPSPSRRRSSHRRWSPGRSQTYTFMCRERGPSGECGCHQGVAAHRAVSGPPGSVSERVIPEGLSDTRQRTNIKPDEEKEEHTSHNDIRLHGLCARASEGIWLKAPTRCPTQNTYHPGSSFLLVSPSEDCCFNSTCLTQQL